MSLSRTLLTVIASGAAGAFAWTFAEYALHNWRGHKGKGRNFFSKEHLRHHAETDYFTPTRTKLVLAGRILLVAIPLALIVAGWAVGGGFMLGFIGCYLGYEVLHRRLHTHPPRGAYGRWARRHHFAHHFRCPNHNHGVTTPLWDILLGTWRRHTGPVRVPEKHAMSWLLDPDSGQVRDAYAGDFTLARPHRRSARCAGFAAPPPSGEEKCGVSLRT